MDIDEAVKINEENVGKEIKQPTKTQREKLRALRDEFGFQPTKPKKDNDND
jgi:hypothetical protein